MNTYTNSKVYELNHNTQFGESKNTNENIYQTIKRVFKKGSFVAQTLKTAFQTCCDIKCHIYT